MTEEDVALVDYILKSLKTRILIGKRKPGLVYFDYMYDHSTGTVYVDKSVDPTKYQKIVLSSFYGVIGKPASE